MTGEERPDKEKAGGEKKEGPVRPNAEYPLTRRPEAEDPVFYYSREKRLSRASEPVRALYREEPKKRGFLRSLTATKPLATLFASILILSAFILVLAVFGGAEDSRTLGGNRIRVQAMKYEGETYLVLTKTAGKGNVYTGPVDMAVAPEVPGGAEDTPYPVFRNRIFFSLREEEEYRFSVPFEADRLVMVIQGENGSLEFTVISK
ncbi:MAG: hypothetical protein LBG42_01540 [Treponema sp.]|jgi:hypothetical protein|nr:hypothetical protein [Treponema sp.]